MLAGTELKLDFDQQEKNDIAGDDDMKIGSDSNQPY